MVETPLSAEITTAIERVTDYFDRYCTTGADCPMPHSSWHTVHTALLAARQERDALSEKLGEWKSHAMRLQESHGKLEDARQRLAVEASAARRDADALRAALTHVADEINAQRRGSLGQADYETRRYWAQVEGVARDALAAATPERDTR